MEKEEKYELIGKFIAIIIGIIIYFGGGWIAKDIVFSMIEITDETTIRSLIIYEFRIYSIIAGALVLVLLLLTDLLIDDNPSVVIVSLFVIVVAYIIATALPLSTGLIILYHLLNIGGLIWVVLCS